MNSSRERNDTYESSELQDNLEILREIYFFSGLPLESLKVFAYMSTRETFKEGEFLFKKDDNDGQSFYILSGKASLLCQDEKGEHMIREYDPGDFLGGMVLLGNLRRLFSLKASTDLSCLILAREKFLATVQQFPDLMPKIIQSVVVAVGAWEERFINSRDESCEVCGQMAGFSLL